jgi:transcriptional regulator with XRE-family HTH domain
VSQARDEYWPRLLRSFRAREGLTQSAIADRLGVDQSTVSRWERGVDQPALAARRSLRDTFRMSFAGRQDRAIRSRIRHSAWPQTLLRKGAVFLEASSTLIIEARVPVPDLRGRAIYGVFGPQTDQVTEQWERSGLFQGELALCMTVNALEVGAPGERIYIRSLDAPHFSSDDGIWSVSEVKQISRAEYDRFIRDYGGAMMSIPFETLS